MESMGGAISEGEWSSLSGMYITEEADDFIAQLLSSCPLPYELDDGSSNLGIPSTFWPSYCSSDIANTNSYSFSQGSSYSAGSSSILFPSSSQESYCLSDSNPIFVANNSPMSMDFCMEDAIKTSSYLVEGDDCLNQKMGNGNIIQQDGKSHQKPALPNKKLEPKSESDLPQPEPITEKKRNTKSEKYSKKRSRSSGDVQKNRRNAIARSKKNQSSVSTTNNDEEYGNAGLNGQSSASCLSEDDSNASQDLNGGVSSSSSKGEAALSFNGKTRASKGAATDPQSLYARNRREKISERLRILQKLVPNGTKVDISTMLEEAVQYVKFL